MEQLRRQAFTLIELLLAVVIVGVITTAAFVNYRDAVERAAIHECEANLAVLQLVIAEQMAVSGVLSEVTPEMWDRAYAKWQAQQPWWSRALARVKRWGAPAVAEAAFISGTETTTGTGATGTVIIGRQVLLQCPSDQTPPPDGVSYAINPAIVTRADYEGMGAGVPLVYDAEHSGTVPGAAAGWHRERGHDVALLAPKKGKPKPEPRPRPNSQGSRGGGGKGRGLGGGGDHPG